MTFGEICDKKDDIVVKPNKAFRGDIRISLDDDLSSMEGAPPKVLGKLSLRGGDLTSLKGAPQIVTKTFFMQRMRRLTTLEGGPIRVGGDYTARQCSLTTLKGCAQHIGGDLWIEDNKFKSREQIIDEMIKYEIYVEGEISDGFGEDFKFDITDAVKRKRIGKFKDFLDL